MAVHDEKKPYSCEKCGAKFLDPSAFKRHSSVHTGANYVENLLPEKVL